jgi:hypothetical protein
MTISFSHCPCHHSVQAFIHSTAGIHRESCLPSSQHCKY